MIGADTHKSTHCRHVSGRPERCLIGHGMYDDSVHAGGRLAVGVALHALALVLTASALVFAVRLVLRGDA